MPRYDVQEFARPQDDFSHGIVGRISPSGMRGRPPQVKAARNAIWRPKRAAGVRPGYRDTATGVLSEVPTSLGKHYHVSGNKAFVATASNHIFRWTATGRTQQTLPGGFTATGAWWRFEMANALLIGTQIDNSGAPIFWSNSNTANTWESLVLPKPVAAITFNADSAGGFLADTKTYYWRHRYRYTNGSSLAGPVSAGNVMNTPNLTANLNVPLPASARSDYLGWTLERTAQNGDATGPFYFVADGTAATTSDGKADSSLGYEADETLHGEPVAMDGTIFHKGRLFGWRGSTLFLSQPIVGLEGTGLANWVGDQTFPVAKDDGDSIQTVLIQSDRLAILKRHSVHTLEGDDLDSFRLSVRAEGVGAAGPRAACSIGGAIMFAAGDGRMFSMVGNAVRPLAAEEMGDYLADMDLTRDDEIVAVNYLGDFVLFWYVARGKSYPDDVLAYDLRFGVWAHWDSMPAVDALVQKDRIDFNSATLLFADPRALPPGSSSAASTNPSFVTWLDKRDAANWQTRIQKMSSAGVAQWTAGGVQVGASTGTYFENDYHSVVVPDGTGGCIVLFTDQRSGFGNMDIYGQRFNSAGAEQWTAGGILLESIASYVGNGGPSLAYLASDRNGGVIYLYRNKATGLYAQRLNSAGAKQWGGGTKVGNATNGFIGYGVITPRALVNSDASCEVSWLVNSTGPNYQIRADKLNAAGALQWGGAGLGILVQTFQGDSTNAPSCADDAGGLIVSYTTTVAVFVHRLDASGAKLWGANGVQVDNGVADPVALTRLARDGAAGCFAIWRQKINPTTNYHLKARRILAAGTAAWAAVQLNTANPLVPAQTVSVVEDGSGGAVAVWDGGSVSTYGVWLNGVNASGVPLLGAELVVADAANSQLSSVAVTDGFGGVVIAWDDQREAASLTGQDVYMRRVGVGGVNQWAANGVDVSGQATKQESLRSLCFTDTPEGEFPPGVASGYHIWSGMRGTVDEAAADGTAGRAIPYEIAGHRRDEGLPNDTKDYEEIYLNVNKGTGRFTVTVETDIGATATVVLEVESNLDLWNDGSLWDDGSVWGTDGEASVFAGLPLGTEGQRASVTLRADLTEECEIGSYMLRGYVLPQESFS